MTISPPIIVLLVAFAALVLGILIYLINSREAKRADWKMQKADDLIYKEMVESRRFVEGKSRREQPKSPLFKPRHP